MIVLMGIKHSGKTCIGKKAAAHLNIPFYDLDNLLEVQYSSDRDLNFRELYIKLGESGFRDLELRAIDSINLSEKGILALGGGTIDNPGVMKAIKKAELLFFLDVDENILYKRIEQNGFPSFLKESPKLLFHNLYERRKKLYSEIADKTLNIANKNQENAAQLLIKELKDRQ
jgi:shikimate kinase